MPDHLIETRRLTKRYGDRLAVDGVDLRVRRGEVYGFLGPNGAGKTTTLRMLLGLARATSGTARVLGAAPGQAAALARIGMLVEAPGFYPYLSGRDNLRVVARYAGVPTPRVDAVLDLVQLAGRGADRFGTYSLGMKQRLGVAAALLKEPELLVLDEPTNGLDPAGMAALDATIVNIALPSAQVSLRFSAADRQWVVTAYSLAFGGLLLLGGRLVDLFGSKRTFLVGLAGFAGISGIGAAATGLPMLIAARAAQGAFAALLAPTALALLAVTFTGSRDRAKAFAVYGAVAGGGAAVGLLLGGVLTEYASWRWCLYVNIPVAAVAAGGGWLFVTSGPAGGRRRIDAGGAVLATGGLVALVYGCNQALRRGWTSAPVLGLLVLSVALLALFIVLESKLDAPLLPLPIVLDRNRVGAYLAIFVAIASMFGLFLFLTYYLQVVLGYSPIQAGLAFLPMTAATIAGSAAIATRLLPRVGPRALMVPALLVASAGMALLTRLDTNSGYPTVVLPAEILIGLAMSCVMVPAFSLATRGVDQRAAGVASAVANSAQQAGAAVGTAVLNTLATSATAGYLATRPPDAATHVHGLIHGYSVAAASCTVALAVAAIAVGILINTPRPNRHPDPDPEEPAGAQTLGFSPTN